MTGPPGWTLDVELPPDGPLPHEQAAYRTLYACAADGNDVALRFHPNGLCVVCLAPSHVSLQDSSSGGDDGGAAGAAAGAATAGAAAPQAAAAGDSSAPQPAPSAASDAAPPPAARLALSPKLLGATFRKGRGPLLMPDSILGRLSVGRGGGCGGGAAEVVLRAGVRGLLVDLNNRLGELRGAELLRCVARRCLRHADGAGGGPQKLHSPPDSPLPPSHALQRAAALVPGRPGCASGGRGRGGCKVPDRGAVSGAAAGAAGAGSGRAARAASG